MRATLVLSIALVAVGCGGGDPRDTADPAASEESFDSLFALAEEVYFAGQYDSARALLTSMQEEARQEGAVEAEARAMTWVGLVAYRTAEYDEATRIGREALQLKLRHGLDDQLARSYNALGLVSYMQNRFTESLGWYARADTVARAMGDERTRVTVEGNLALSLIELGRFTAAREKLSGVRDFMAANDEVRLEGNALANVGMLDIRLGDPASGLGSLREAIELYEGIEYPTGVSNALAHMGSGYHLLGQPSTALATLDSALVLARGQGLTSDEASIYELMAEVYRSAGDFTRALELYDRAREINARIGADWELGIDMRGQADIRVRLGDHGTARGLALEALEIHRRVEAPLEEMRDLLMLAEVDYSRGDSASVVRLLAEARDLAAALGAPIARVEVALTAASIHDGHRRSRAVLAELDRVAGDLPRAGYAAEWEAAQLRSRAYLRLGQLESAAIAGRAAVTAVERVRANFGSAALRTTFGADKRDVYAQLVSVLVRSGEVEEAFEVADGARGRALLELGTRVSGRGARVSALDQGEVLLREIQGVEEQLEYLEDFPRSARTSTDQEELEGLYRSLQQLRSRYELLAVQAAEVEPNLAAFLGGRRTDADIVRRSLRPGQLLLEYFVPREGAVVLFVVSQQDVRVLETQVQVENLTTRVRLARELIARQDGEGPRDNVLRGLYSALVRPAVAAGLTADAHELVIVPHDVLTYLPFAALLDETTGRYLVEDYTLRVLPSAASLPLLRAGGDGRAEEGASVFAPFPSELPASAEEARVVVDRLRARGHEAGRATESLLRKALEESRVVHLATHGELNRLNPAFSRLELAPGSGDTADDGRLEVHELLDLEIRSDLVFLSGCETGLGLAGSTAFAVGEDYATLAQAMLLAGARNVVATLWAVEDRASAELAGRFYEALGERDAASALAEAQRLMLSSAELSDPYYWAAYQVAGVGEL